MRFFHSKNVSVELCDEQTSATQEHQKGPVFVIYRDK